MNHMSELLPRAEHAAEYERPTSERVPDSTTLSGELWFDLDRRTGTKTTRIPHAPSTPLPELAEFLAPFRAHFRRSEGAQSLERYLTGLLAEHPNKG